VAGLTKNIATLASIALISMAAATCSWPALAQPAPPADAKSKTEATRKFREGEAAFLRGDYLSAAVAFEASYRLAIHPNTLVNAIESWEKVGNALFAARQCLRLRNDFPGGRDAAFANERLERLAPRIAQLEIQAKGSSKGLVIDGVPAAVGLNIIEPGEHVVIAELDGKPIEKRVRVGLGGKATVVLEPAPSSPTAPIVPAQPPAPPAPVADTLPTPLHTAFFTGAATLTLASGALLVWSGLDAKAAYDEFEARPTQAGLDDGRSKELRTNVLIGTTAGLGFVSAALGVFTDWDGSFAAKSASLRISPTFASLELALP
jgi:hypothetical protein